MIIRKLHVGVANYSEVAFSNQLKTKGRCWKITLERSSGKCPLETSSSPLMNSALPGLLLALEYISVSLVEQQMKSLICIVGPHSMHKYRKRVTRGLRQTWVIAADSCLLSHAGEDDHWGGWHTSAILTSLSLSQASIVKFA